MGPERARARRPRRPVAPPLPSFRPDVLAAVNAMERATDPLQVATAALMHHGFTRGVVPDYHLLLNADRLADVVLSALYRRGML